MDDTEDYSPSVTEKTLEIIYDTGLSNNRDGPDTTPSENLGTQSMSDDSNRLKLGSSSPPSQSANSALEKDGFRGKREDTVQEAVATSPGKSKEGKKKRGLKKSKAQQVRG